MTASVVQTQPQQQFTDEQIDQLLIAIKSMKNSNLIAGLLWTALEKNPDREDKRKILVIGFAQSYELMLVMNMGMQSNMPPAIFKRNLEEQRRASAS